MRRILSLTYVLFLSICIVGDAIAALSFLPESGLVLDDKGDQNITNDQYWIADISLLTNMTYAEQKESIESWNEENSQFYNAQLTPWHMATDLEAEALRSFHVTEIFSAFSPSHASVVDSVSLKLYKGRTDVMHTSLPEHMLYYIDAAFKSEEEWSAISFWAPIPDDNIDIYQGAWVTASYSATAVPIPPSFYLLLSSLIGLLGFKKKFRNR